MQPWAKKQIDEAMKPKRKSSNGTAKRSKRNKAKTARHRTSVSNADLERTAGDELLAAGQGKAFAQRVSLTVSSFRSRLADPDGVSVKYAIDCLVKCGILADDSAKVIDEVRQPPQVKVKNVDQEKTVIVITALD